MCACVCVCDPLNRTGANFVMVALVLKTFVTRLLLLVHFQLCVLVCVSFPTSAYLAVVIAFVTIGIILLTKLKYL